MDSLPPDSLVPRDEIWITPQVVITPFKRYDLAQVTACAVKVEPLSLAIKVGAWMGGGAFTILVISLTIAKGFSDSNRALHILFAGPLLMIWAATKAKLSYRVMLTLGGDAREVLRTRNLDYAESVRRIVEMMRTSPRGGYRVDLKTEKITVLDRVAAQKSAT
jgi:hypothetical protein